MTGADRSTTDEAVRLFDELSNWERWGRDDERGTLNYITPAKVVEAFGLVRGGRTLSIAHDVVTTPGPAADIPRGPASPAVLTVFGPQEPMNAASCELTVRAHGFTPTHLDALAHCSYEGRVWNGRPLAEAVTAEGVRFGSMAPQLDGIVTRGVLLDVARARGVARLERGDAIVPADLDAAERLAGTTVRSGDAVFVRSGMGLRVSSPEDLAMRTGLAPECARWLHARQVSLFGSDCPERMPSGFDERLLIAFHQIVLVQLGLILLDNVAMEPLARACAEERRADFLFMVAPLRIASATGCVVNPVVVF